MAGVDDALLTQAKYFKYYDNYVVSQLPIWAKQELTPNEVVSQLGLQRLSGVELMSNPNFKYYDQYLGQQALVWAKKDLSLDDILVRLNLNTLPVAARPHDVNFKYYEESVGGLMKTWMKKGTPLDEVMAKLKLDQLTGEALVSHRNYKYYKNHVKNYLKEWALYDVTVNDVAAMLGLENKFGEVLKAQPNYVFLKKYWETSLKYQEEGMLREGITSFQVWKELEVFRVKPTIRKRSGTYQSYKRYVNLMDDYIIDMKESGFKYDELPRMTSKDATPDELHEKTLIWSSQRRPEWYVKFSLGLDNLTEDALKAAPNYRYYEYYLEAMKRVTTTT
ncbi:hypothetical protein GN244_ATG10573 [Phytophthora infestans]|uniref:RxLR effector protein n=1 Tax=Phytophthora infestans TaxID=4787 RepID=A0A833T4B0_PHYIN|nr:hypothetical protein GN244_ATG10573 [Phytophthora infestans]